ncbi:molybdopterin-dependent oxidoreductase [Thermodesulfobacteriota bacterium]
MKKLFFLPSWKYNSQKVVEETSEEVQVPSLCDNSCIFGPCLLNINVVNDIAVGIEPNTEGEGFKEFSRNLGSLCPKAYGWIQKLYNPHRIKNPLKRTNPEKGRGVDPGWVSISWEEALDTIAKKLKKIRMEDTRKVAEGGPGVGGIYSSESWAVFFRAFGPTQLLLSGESDKCYLGEHQWGNRIHGAMMCESDVKHCNYLILIGLNQVASRGAVEGVRYADARERGMKIVAIDPICTPTAAMADEWIPIRPGTDTAFLLAMINVIINEIGIYDVGFLKDMTNSPYLVKPDGYFMRDKKTKKVLVWDKGDQKIKSYDDATIKDFALEGTYQVEDIECKPAFHLLKDHIKQYTVEWAESVTDIDAVTIRRLTREFVENSRIGSTINIDGLTLPYRPANIHLGRGVEGAMGQYHAVIANHIIAALIGSIEVPGGHCGGIDSHRIEQNGVTFHTDPFFQGIKPGEDGMNDMQATPFTWPPVSHGATEVLLPFGLYSQYPDGPVKNPSDLHSGQMRHMEWANLANPQKGLPESLIPEVWIRYRLNPFMSLGEPELVAKALKKIPFIVSFAYTEDEITDYADILLPDSIEFERYQISFRMRLATSKKIYQIGLQQPVAKPIHNTMDLNDVFIELADKIGFLDEMNMGINISLDLKDPYKLDPDKKYTWEEVVYRQCKSYTNGTYDLEWFKKNGALVGKVPVEDEYEIHLKMKEKKLRYPIPYMEKVKREGEKLAKNLIKVGIDWWPTDEYVPLPAYFPQILDEVPSEYDLYIINTRVITDSWGNNLQLPWIDELGRHLQGYANITMHEDTAKAKGIKNEDTVWVETPVDKIKHKVKLTQGIRPDCLQIIGMGGHWKMPIAKDANRPSHSRLTPMNYKWTDKMTGGMQSSALKCKIYKAS